MYVVLCCTAKGSDTMAKRINYDEFTITTNGEPCEQALMNYYSTLIDFLVERFGADPVRIALEELINES